MKAFDASHFNLDRCKPFLHVGGETGVLLIHGFTGSVANMRPLGDALADLGYTVMGINLPGHATTEADMAASNARQWLQAAREAAIQLRRKCATVVVAGLSMGGVLALLLASEGLVDACVTLSAPMALHNRLARFTPWLAPVMPRISKAPTDERHRLIDASFDYGYSGFPSRKMADLLWLIRRARKQMPDVTCPLLVVQSDGDHTIWLGSAGWIDAHVNSKNKQLLALRGVHHVCTLSPALPEIVSTMDTWLHTL